MTDRPAPRVAYWPFLLADLVFLGLAYLILELGHRPLQLLEVYGVILCVGAGVWCFLMPFRARLKMAESENLVSAAAQIKNLDLVAAQISSATTLWQGVQEESSKAAAAAKQVTDRMVEESKAFCAFLEKANDTEKNHLRLEVEKLHRAQSDWMQILIHILDHTYALHRAASRSKQRGVAEQIAQFQNACLDSARRVGLASFIVENGAAFDPEKHQLLDGDTAKENAAVTETIAPGYTFQGRLIRPALVRLQTELMENESASAETEAVSTAQTQLF